jgi:hypothetical protein
MNFISTIIKWLFGIGMAIGLVAGIIIISATQTDKDTVPQSAADLATVKVTVAEQHIPEGGDMSTVTTQEYPNGSMVMPIRTGYSAASTLIILKPDEQINIDIRKQDVELLDSGTPVVVWGARSSDGKSFLDANQMIENINSPIMKSIGQFAYALIVLPVLYFIGLFISLFKKKGPRARA